VTQSNTYSIYAGIHEGHEREIMRVDEVSDKCNRFWCGPLHPFRLEFREYVPIPGDGTLSDYSHLSIAQKAELKNWEVSPEALQNGLRSLYKAQPILFTAIRDDGMRCGMPCKLLRTIPISPFCADGVHLYVGSFGKHLIKEGD
jgi:hypothetical protein